VGLDARRIIAITQLAAVAPARTMRPSFTTAVQLLDRPVIPLAGRFLSTQALGL